MPTVKSQTVSIGLHLAAVALLLFLTSRSIVAPPPAATPNPHITILAPLHRVHLTPTAQNSGGSNQTALPARRGAPPPRATRTYIPPANPENPKLPMPVTIAADSPTITVAYNQMGDPLSAYREGMLGRNGGDRIGNGDPRGKGIGHGDRPGITVGTPGHAVSAPLLIFKVEPEFSEEARKAKYSGMVVLSIVVDASGRATDFRVLQSPGLGLDQKAIEAVAKWRFKPGYQDGKAVVTGATVEVRFQLL